MNVQEGARRMRQAGEWMVTIPLGIVLVLCTIAALVNLRVLVILWPFLLSVSASLAIPGGLLWLAGWIVEGFAQQDS
jgi:hypothetical protein